MLMVVLLLSIKTALVKALFHILFQLKQCSHIRKTEVDQFLFPLLGTSVSVRLRTPRQLILWRSTPLIYKE
jgi:hypothetical protein